MNTENARAEEVHWKDRYTGPWGLGQSCIIPAATFDEPNWETGKNVGWRFRRVEGTSWAWPGCGTPGRTKPPVVHEGYTMFTLNANAHPLMSRMHRPVVDPVTKQTLPLGRQDKRSVMPLASVNFDQWLEGAVEETKAVMRLAPVKVFDAVPTEPAPPDVV